MVVNTFSHMAVDDTFSHMAVDKAMKKIYWWITPNKLIFLVI